MTGEDEAEVDAYFAPDFRFHGPEGGEWDYQGFKEYFSALRAAFDNLTITRGIVVAEGQPRGLPERQSPEPSCASSRDYLIVSPPEMAQLAQAAG